MRDRSGALGGRDAHGAVCAVSALRAADARRRGTRAGPDAARPRRAGERLQRRPAGRPRVCRGDGAPAGRLGPDLGAHAALRARRPCEPRSVPGGCAPPRPRRRSVPRWFRAFLADAAEQAGRAETIDGDHFSSEEVDERIAEGRVGLWEVDGTVVHMTGHHGPSLGVARVGPVYTPRAHRGRGYASAAVAEVSRRLHDDGDGSASSPTRRTPRPTGSTRRSATGRSPTWRT